MRGHQRPGYQPEHDLSEDDLPEQAPDIPDWAPPTSAHRPAPPPHSAPPMAPVIAAIDRVTAQLAELTAAAAALADALKRPAFEIQIINRTEPDATPSYYARSGTVDCTTGTGLTFGAGGGSPNGQRGPATAGPPPQPQLHRHDGEATT